MTITKEEFAQQHGAPIQTGGRWLHPDGAQSKDGPVLRFLLPPWDDDELEALKREHQQAVLNQQMERIRTRGESFDDFSRRQGCQHRIVKGRYVFRNGATWNDRPDAYGAGSEPPQELYARLRIQEAYLRADLAAEEAAFRTFRKHCAEAASNAARFVNCVSPPPDVVPQLEAGRQRIFDLRRELADVLAEIGQGPDALALRESLECQQRQRQDADSLHGQILSVNI